MADKRPRSDRDAEAIKRIEKLGKALTPRKPPPPQKRPGHTRDDQ